MRYIVHLLHIYQWGQSTILADIVAMEIVSANLM